MNPDSNPLLTLTAMAAALASALAAAGPVDVAPPADAISMVESCADSGPGSLREVVAGAPTGHTIDLGSLACDAIVLSSGAIIVPQDDLAIVGPGRDTLAIDGGGESATSRVFEHRGTGWFSISGVSVRNGMQVDDTPPGQGAASGGCVHSLGSVRLQQSRVTGCRAFETAAAMNALGGGVYASADLAVEYSLLTDNQATASHRYARGGGAYARGSVEVLASTISGNIAEASAYSGGGGLFVLGQGDGDSSIRRSTISGNSAYQGGALLLRTSQGHSVSLVNSTVSGNVASHAGGIYSNAGLAVRNSTVVMNRAASSAGLAAGIAMMGSDLDLQSTIVAGNLIVGDGVASDLSIAGGGALAGANNLVSAAIAELPADTLVADPMLDPLSWNGGPTATHALQAGSVAIDTGNNAAGLSSDQRGAAFPREVGAAPDIGALEHSGTPSDVVFADGFDAPAARCNPCNSLR